MGRKISQFISIALLSAISFTAWSGGAVVFDATNAPRFVTLVAEAKKQFQELRGVSEKMEALNGRLGGGLLNMDTERLSQLNTKAREWGVYLDGFGASNADELSLLNGLGFRNFGSGTNRLLEINQYLSGRLYPAHQGEVSTTQLEEIKRVRNESLEKCSINGVALAGEKKHSLRDSQRKIAEIGSQAVRAPTLHDDLVITNQLLTLIATELVQQRELLSQELELISAVVVQGAPLIAKRPIEARN